MLNVLTVNILFFFFLYLRMYMKMTSAFTKHYQYI